MKDTDESAISLDNLPQLSLVKLKKFSIISANEFATFHESGYLSWRYLLGADGKPVSIEKQAAVVNV